MRCPKLDIMPYQWAQSTSMFRLLSLLFKNELYSLLWPDDSFLAKCNWIHCTVYWKTVLHHFPLYSPRGYHYFPPDTTPPPNLVGGSEIMLYIAATEKGLTNYPSCGPTKYNCSKLCYKSVPLLSRFDLVSRNLELHNNNNNYYVYIYIDWTNRNLIVAVEVISGKNNSNCS